jgi:hypothetical protein
VEPTPEELELAYKAGMQATADYELEHGLSGGVPTSPYGRSTVYPLGVPPNPGWNFGGGASGVIEVRGKFLREDDAARQRYILQDLLDRLEARLNADTALGIGNGENMLGLIGLMGDIGMALGPTSYPRSPTEIQDFTLRARPFLEKKEVREDADPYVAMRSIKVTFSDGDVITTSINGTKKDILAYYLNSSPTDTAAGGLQTPIAVEFLDEA